MAREASPGGNWGGEIRILLGFPLCGGMESLSMFRIISPITT